MSQRMRKADRAIAKPTLEPKICCPVCALPPSVEEVFTGKPGLIASEKNDHGCQFFARMADKKFSDDPDESARLRIEHFRKYHHAMCPRCRRDIVRCRQIRTMAVKRRLKGEKLQVTNASLFGEDKGSYVTPEQLKALVDAELCSEPKQKFRAVKPEWWRPS